MAEIINDVLLTDTFDEWRTKTNRIINKVNVMNLGEDALTLKESSAPVNPDEGYSTFWISINASGTPQLKLTVTSTIEGTEVTKTYTVNSLTEDPS